MAKARLLYDKNKRRSPCLERVYKAMVNLKDMEFYESEFVKNVTQGTIEECRKFMAAQQEFIRSLVKENERLRERVLDDFIGN